MNVEQFYTNLEKKGQSREDYIKRVSLLFFAADLAETLATDLEAIMAPFGALDGNLKGHIKKVHQHASAIIRQSDKSLTSERQEVFAEDGERFSSIAYGWAGITLEKPFLKSDLRRLLEAKKESSLKVVTMADLWRIIADIELSSKTLNE